MGTRGTGAARNSTAAREKPGLPEDGESPRTLAGGCILVPILIGLKRSVLSVVWVIYVGRYFGSADFSGGIEHIRVSPQTRNLHHKREFLPDKS